MPDLIPSGTLAKFTTFGDLLRFLRRRAGITQLELSIAIGYSGAQISRLEQNLRIPDLPTIEARFISSLCLEDEPRAIARLLELAAAVRREDAPKLGLCPYKGLDYFDEADADLFVGREALTEQLVNSVLSLASKEQANETRFFAVVGASGSGKSSLVRAGLVPALRWNKISSNWPIHILTPTAHPLESLANTLTRENSSLAATATLMDDLAREQRVLGIFISRELKDSPRSYLVLVIDQFEELFALCRSETERSIFIDNLLLAACDAEGKAIVIITLRADFYTYCSGYPHLRKALATHQEYIGAMSDEEMRRSIEEPARRGHWEFEPGLVDLILHDVGHEPGALPLLSHALFETWQRRHGTKLTLSGYTSAGGVRGAIAETAETVFTDQFTHQQQTIARRIFLRLTELGDETATGDTRRRATFDELILKPEETEATRVVLKALADARLVTTSEDSVQVAHEALIREWPTLRGWLEENREGLRLHRQLTDAAQEWLATERGPDSLFRGARLAQGREWAETHSEDMNALEREFLDASIAFSESEAAEREAARLRELEAAQKLAEAERKRANAEQERAEVQTKATRRLRIRSFLSVGSGALAIILAILAFFAWRQSASQAAVNLSLSLASAAQQANQKGYSDLALRLAMEAAEINQAPPGALMALREVALGTGTRAVLIGHKLSAQAVDISPDSETALSGSCAQLDAQGTCQAGELILWDLTTMKEIRRWSAHQDWVNKVAYSSDGQYLISNAQDGSLTLWNLNGEKIEELSDLPGKITDLAALPNTASVLLCFDDGSMVLWDMQTGDKQSFPLSPSPITALAVAMQAPLAVTAHQDGSLTLWNLFTRQPIRAFPDRGNEILTVAISPSGDRIFYADNHTSNWGIQEIDSQEGQRLFEQSFNCAVRDLAINFNGTYLLAGCAVETLLIDLQNWGTQDHLYGFPDLVNAVSINQYGNLGISANKDGSLSVWNLGSQESFESIDLGADHLTAFAVSPDGKHLLLTDAQKDGKTQPALWDIVHKTVVVTYALPISEISPGGLKISPDGYYAAAAGLSDVPTILLWNLESGELLCPPFEDFAGFDGYTVYGRAVAFSPNGQFLLAGSQTIYGPLGELFLWDIQSCKLASQFDTTEDITSIAFSSDGSRAITGTGFKGKVALWDTATGKLLEQYTHPDNGALAVAFGPGDQTILGSGVPNLYLFDTNTKSTLKIYTGLTTYPFDMALSPDGKYLLSGTSNGDMILWNFSTGEEVSRLYTHLNVWSVGFSTDSTIAFAGTDEGKLIEWHIAEQSLPELLDWIKANRYVRELTCPEKLQYNIADPQCK